MAKNNTAAPKGKSPGITAANTKQHHRMAMGQKIPQNKPGKPSTSKK